MQKLTSTNRLKNAIQLLEIEQAVKEQELKEQFQATYNRFKPINLLKNSLKNISASPNLVDNILGTTVGLATGYLSKKVVVGTSANLIKKLFGTVLQFGVTTFVAKHPEAIKSIGNYIIKKLPLRKNLKSEKS